MFDHSRTAGKILLIPEEAVLPSPYQARRAFDQKELQGLADSIQKNGLLQPITVRRCAVGAGYELIAGERRLRACRLAGMKTVPAIVQDLEDPQTAALGLLENLQRADLNPFEQAKGIRDVMELWGGTQADAAKRLGIAQPTLANKLRLLQLTQTQQDYITLNGLTERHARAVLRLPEQKRDKALAAMAKNGLNARAADQYVEQLLDAKPAPKRIPMVRDVRIFINTINHAVRLMTQHGVAATAIQREGEGYIEYTVHIPVQDTAGMLNTASKVPKASVQRILTEQEAETVVSLVGLSAPEKAYSAQSVPDPMEVEQAASGNIWAPASELPGKQPQDAEAECSTRQPAAAGAAVD